MPASALTVQEMAAKKRPPCRSDVDREARRANPCAVNLHAAEQASLGCKAKIHLAQRVKERAALGSSGAKQEYFGTLQGGLLL